MAVESAGTRLDTLQAIELAEGVEVRLRIAGPLLRGGAYAMDLLFRIVVFLILMFFFSMAGIFMGGLTVAGIWLLLWFFLEWIYAIFFEASKWGATPGKKILGLKVVQTSGAPITLGQAILRNFLRAADGMPFFGHVFAGFFPSYGIGLAVMLATKRFQRLGDLAAGTVVVYDRIPPEPVVPTPPPVEKVVPAVALRPDEVRALTSFRDRAGLWSESRREEIADHAKELSGTRGATGVSRLMAMAHWLQERR